MLRTLTPEEQHSFMNRDVEMTTAILTTLASRGVHLSVSSTELAGLLRALVFVAMHRDDIGAQVAPAVEDFLVAALAKALVVAEEGEPA